MKRTIIFLALVLCLLFLASCGAPEKADVFLDGGEVRAVEVSSMPHGYSYSFSGSEAERVVDYISALHLESSFTEDPNVYTGMTWVVDIEYADGDTDTVYMFGNTFIRKGDSDWLKMEYKEAEGFSELLESLDK